MNAMVITGSAGLALIAYGVINFLRDRSRSARTDSHLNPEQTIDSSIYLKDFCHIWERDEINLADIAFIWRDIETGKPEIKRPRPVFSNKSIDTFYSKFVDIPVVKGNRRIVIEKILKLLDDMGDCPSIVGRGAFENDNEPERGYSKDLYEHFANIPLWKYILDVAEIYISKFQYKVQIPDALIISLGHDLGMITDQYVRYYTKLTHPEISLLILKAIPEYNLLDNAEDLNSIIKLHHSITNLPDARILKAADLEVRNTDRYIVNSNTGTNESTEVQKAVNIDSTDICPPEAPISITNDFLFSESTISTEQQNDVPSVELDQSKYEPQEITPLPPWLAFDAIISYIEKHINVLEKSTDLGLTWSAYSVREGYVWVKDVLLWDAVLKTSMENSFLTSAEGNKYQRINVLYTVVCELSRQGKTAKSMIKNGFFQTPVKILAGKGKPLFTVMTPFIPGAFGILPDDLEKRKGASLNKAVVNIVPNMQGDNTI